MQEYIGMNFHDWCKLEPDDKRKINYTLKDKHGTEIKFDSTVVVKRIIITRLLESSIEDINLIDNEWHVVLLSPWKLPENM